jgi:serine/threonine protein kinase
MQEKAQDDDRVMSLVDLALARPAEERTVYLRSACAGDLDLYREVWNYVEWETRMRGFLMTPFFSPAAMEHPFEAGELLANRFRIVREVAQGGMGVVYEAMDQKLGRTIGLKCAKAGFGNRLPPEVRHATAISHPNVCKIFEIHTASTQFGEIEFLTMEFLVGETLAQRLSRGVLSDGEAAAIAQQLCAGLAEAHRNGVIHGDLKSNNIILTRSADGGVRAVITDFGLARGAEAPLAGHAGVSGGTPDYMAPELWRGAKPSVASDLYALGVILHELAYGGRPSLAKSIATKPKWDRVITRCLDPDPVLRFEDATEVAQALAPVWRLRWWQAAAAAVIVAAVAGAITYKGATMPSRSLRLAVAPFDGEAAGRVFPGVESEVKRLKGGKAARLNFVPAADKTASHVVRGSITQENGKVVLRVKLVDPHSGATVDEREFTYPPPDVHFAPTAVAAMVTGALSLPPPPVAPVNAAAKTDYVTGLNFTRRNSTVDQALPLLERAVAEDRDSPLTWAALAEGQWFKYWVTKDQSWLNRAAASLGQAQNRNLDVAAVHRAAGLLKSYEDAAAEYRRAIDLEPGNADAHRRLAQAYRTADPNKALAEYWKAIDLEPNYFKNYQTLGTFYLDRDELDKAAREFEKCVQLAPDEADAHYALGTNYQAMGNFAASERELRRAIELHPTPQERNNLATTLKFEGRDREAISLLQLAIFGLPHNYLLWLNLGDAYRRTKQPTESQRAYREALRLAENTIGSDSRAPLPHAHLGYLCARLHQPERARSEIKQALNLAKSAADTVEMAVWTYEALGQREQAMDLLRPAPDGVLTDVIRWPDLADLSHYPRFVELSRLRKIQ